MGKVLEKVVHKHLFNYIRDHEILSALQSGFIPGDLTVNQLVDIYNTFCKSLDEGKEVRAVFCDVRKALTEYGTEASNSLNLSLLVFLIPYYYGSRVI